MNSTEQPEQEFLVILSDHVVYDSLKRTLSRGKKTVSLSENESCLLKLLLNKTSSKREVMYEIWEKRGTIVTESSYYKLVRQLRLSFRKMELDENLIMTLPRIGILYTGTKLETKNSCSNYERKNAYSYMKCFFHKFFGRIVL
ncbi:hypothetical protein RZ760_017375 [Providencia rettgeri]|nr:hypothetical protein [Providencia rettgeri]